MIEDIKISTSQRVQFVDITAAVRSSIRKSGVKNGLAVVYVPHTTAGVTINESADPSVVSDIINKLNDLIPRHGSYRHAEGNSDAHIKASMMGSSASVIISEGNLLLGVWQGIFFCEFDGPRSRKIVVKIISA